MPRLPKPGRVPVPGGRMRARRRGACAPGWTSRAGALPADTARAELGSTRWFRNAAAIWERPAFLMHAKHTVVVAGSAVAAGAGSSAAAAGRAGGAGAAMASVASLCVYAYFKPLYSSRQTPHKMARPGGSRESEDNVFVTCGDPGRERRPVPLSRLCACAYFKPLYSSRHTSDEMARPGGSRGSEETVLVSCGPCDPGREAGLQCRVGGATAEAWCTAGGEAHCRVPQVRRRAAAPPGATER
jgi:hypothetical protein